MNADGAMVGTRRAQSIASATAVERLASQMDTQRREYAAQIDALQQQHSAETAEQQQALEQLRYEKELAEAAAAQKQQQLEASEAGASPGTGLWSCAPA